MYEQDVHEEGRQHRCLATHPFGGDPCKKVAVVEFRGLRYCEAHGREIEAALRVDLPVQTYNLLCRWTRETEHLDNPLLAGLLRDATRRAAARLHRAEAEYEQARSGSRRAERPRKIEA